LDEIEDASVVRSEKLLKVSPVSSIFKITEGNYVYARKHLKRQHAHLVDREADILKKLWKTAGEVGVIPNIICCIGRTQRDIFLNFIDGRDLFDTIRCFKLSMRTCWDLFTQLYSAVQFVHACGCVHLDVKCENCMMDCNGKLTLIDFATTRSLPFTVTEPVGTEEYTAPEVRYGCSLTEKSDYWSMGVVLAVIATRKFPPKQQIGSCEWIQHLPSDAPPRISTNISSLLSVCPESRFVVMHET
jgi:serine/threonine protein kinase